MKGAMPTLITREEALARIRAEGGEPPCLMCAIRDRKVGPTYAVFEDDEQLVFLPRYTRKWGHTSILPKAHVTTYSEIDPAIWARSCELAHRAARLVERVMKPRRCYVASTGSAAGELVQTSVHLHWHIIPIYDPNDRPADIFSWSLGINVAEPEEWAEILARYREAWPTVWP
jgi:histidine triad (HIT) family protein